MAPILTEREALPRSRRYGLLWATVLLMAAASAWAHVGLQPPAAPTPPPLPAAEVVPRWSAALYCQGHQRFFGSFPVAAPETSPAAETLASALYGWMLFGPEARFTLRLVAKGVLADGVLTGDLCLRSVHPMALRTEELWSAVQATRRSGVKRIRGRVLWQSDLVPGQQQPHPDFLDRLALAGIAVEPPPAPPFPQPESELWTWDSRPLALLLMREPSLLRSILPEPGSLRRSLQNLDRQGADWLPQAFPRLEPQQVLGFLQRILAREQPGAGLAAAFRPLPSGSRLRLLRGIVSRSPQVTEVFGQAELPGHGPVLIDLRIAAEVAEADLGKFFDRALQETLGEAGQFLALQELPGRDPSSGFQHLPEGADGRRPEFL